MSMRGDGNERCVVQLGVMCDRPSWLAVQDVGLRNDVQCNELLAVVRTLLLGPVMERCRGWAQVDGHIFIRTSDLDDVARQIEVARERRRGGEHGRRGR